MPAVAALGVQIVDEAVFGLVDAHPGLLRTFFELEDAYSKPQYEIAGPSVNYDQLLFGEAGDPVKEQAEQNLATASFAALGKARPWASATAAGATRSARSETGSRRRTTRPAASWPRPCDPSPPVSPPSSNRMGCAPFEFQCGSVTRDQFIGERFRLRVRVVDFWGVAYRVQPGFQMLTLQTSGPDGITGTIDDNALSFQFSELHASLSGGGFGVGSTGTTGAGGSGPGFPGGALDAGSGNAGAGTGAASDTPRVRNEFPETLYVNPSLITGADGTATVDMSLADSITQWRVSSLADPRTGVSAGARAA